MKTLNTFASAAIALLLATAAPFASAAEVICIGVPTKAYWPTVVAKAAEERKLFEKEGLKPEITVYRSGAEAFEAMAAGSADLVLVPTSLVAVARTRGVAATLVAGGSNEWSGWVLAVKSDSKLASVKDLEGKNVGITAAGSGSDVLALWAQQNYKTRFNRVPVGGAGLLPNLLNGNLDAAVLYSPLSHQAVRNKSVRLLADFAREMPPNLIGGWAASDKLLADKPRTVVSALNALYGAVAYLQANREYAVKLIADNNDIAPEIAAMEYEGTFLKLTRDASVSTPALATALELARLSGAKELAPPEAVVRKVVVTPTLP